MVDKPIGEQNINIYGHWTLRVKNILHGYLRNSHAFSRVYTHYKYSYTFYHTECVECLININLLVPILAASTFI